MRSFSPAGPSPVPPRRRIGMRAVMVGCAAAAMSVGTLASIGGNAGAASSSVVLHYLQKDISVTFYNASNAVIQGYPPIGGHVSENDADYVGSHSHHAKKSTVSDHLYCTLVASPATADCYSDFSVGGSLLYTDNWTVNLAGNVVSVPISGGTGKFAGYRGTAKFTNIGNTPYSNVVIAVHKK
jgi:hypothetical protein